jgi:hypothetical protein
MEVDVGFGTYYQFNTFGETNRNRAKLPRLLRVRRAEQPTVREAWGLGDDLVTDNPFFHGAYFADVGLRAHLAEGFEVTAILTAEQRGFSDGRFSRNTLNLFPYVNALYANRHGAFHYLFQVGDFYEHMLYEGLTFYNLQGTQSWIFKVGYGPVYLKHFGLSELEEGIGLGIGDLYDYSLGVENVPLGARRAWTLDLKLGYSDNRGARDGDFVNYAARVTYADRLDVYTQWSTREEEGRAFLLGIARETITTDRFLFAVRVEFRRYSAAFNEGFINNVYYCDPEEPARFTNSVHEVFFPLIAYEHPFSQWAVFAEYQGRSVRGFTIQETFQYRLWRNAYGKVDADFNWITAEDQRTFLYPFYVLGLGTRPGGGVEVFLEMTNRVLNLDKHYPTLYATTTPYFMIRVFKPIRFRAENDRRHRP